MRRSMPLEGSTTRPEVMRSVFFSVIQALLCARTKVRAQTKIKAVYGTAKAVPLQNKTALGTTKVVP